MTENAPANGVTRPQPAKPVKPVKMKWCLAQCGQGNSVDAKRVATAILEVLAGLRTPTQAAQATGMSVMRYYQVEARAVQGLVTACEPQPRGRGRTTVEKELKQLRQQRERLERELGRQQALARMAQRTIGLPAPPKVESSPGKGKKRRHRPVVRSLRMVAQLQSSSEEMAAATESKTV